MAERSLCLPPSHIPNPESSLNRIVFGTIFPELKIVITIENLDLRRGGAEAATARLVRHLSERNHEVVIVARHVRLELPPRVQFQPIHIRAPLEGIRQLQFPRQIARYLADHPHDVSIACGRGYAEDIVWAQNGVQAAAVAGQVESYYRTPALQFLRRLQPRFSLRSYVHEHIEDRRFNRCPPPYLIAVSDMVARHARAYYRLSPDHIFVMRNHVVIDFDRFDPERLAPYRQSIRDKIGLTANTVAILCVAQNFKRKGVDPLIHAAAILDAENPTDFRVLIAGGSPRQAAPYIKLAQHLQCAHRIQFVGHQTQVEHLYAASDLFCLPTFYDPCALTVSEAMGCALPVVTSRANGAAELLTHGVNGFIVENPANHRQLADCLRPLLDTQTRRQFSQAALQTVRGYDVRADLDKLIGFIEGVTQSKHSNTPVVTC